MSKRFAINPRVDLVLERFIDAPRQLVWEALTKPEHLKQWYMPRPWGVVANCELDVRPGGMFSIDTASAASNWDAIARQHLTRARINSPARCLSNGWGGRRVSAGMGEPLGKMCGQSAAILPQSNPG